MAEMTPLWAGLKQMEQQEAGTELILQAVHINKWFVQHLAKYIKFYRKSSVERMYLELRVGWTGD